MAEQILISLVERQRCAIEFWNPTTHPSSLWRRFNKTSCGFQVVDALKRRRNIRQNRLFHYPPEACSTFSRSGWSVVRSASLNKRGTSKKRPLPHLHKVPTRSNRMSLRIFRTALIRMYIHTASIPALEPTQPPIQWVPRYFPRVYSGRGVNLTTHLHLAPRLRMHGDIPPIPHTLSWRGA
jgi:hypothetical protein